MYRRTRYYCLTVMLLMALLVSGCGGNSNVSNANLNNITLETAVHDLSVTSSTDDNHNHMLIIAQNDLQNPPINGVSYQSTWTLNHNHYVQLSRADFDTINNGATVTVTSSTSVNPQTGQAHSHHWSISKGTTYTSAIVEGHQHTIVLLNADVETPPAAGVICTSSTSLDHIHQVTLTFQQLETIKNGGQVIALSSTSTNPTTGYSHSHDWTIVRFLETR
jgi:hypothetical protein